MPFAVWLPAKLAAVLGVSAAVVRQMPLALALLYLNAALQQEGLVTFWVDGCNPRRSRAELHEHFSRLLAGKDEGKSGTMEG